MAAASLADISVAEMEKSEQTEIGDERQHIGLHWRILSIEIIRRMEDEIVVPHCRRW